jgi:pimeloyl-ACP methyl ester carboxylesterase
MTGWFKDFEERRFAVNGAEIALRLGGDRSKPALLLLHGFPQTHAMWHRVAQRLRHDFFLVLPDLRGYGDSSHAPGLPDHSNYSKRALAQDFIEVMDTLGIAKFALCGHDRGGRVAHRLALDHPARVTQALRDRHRADAGHVRAHRLRLRPRLLPLVPPDPAAPLPELMIGGNPHAYLHAKLGGWGSGGPGPHRAARAGRVRTLLLPRRGDPHRLRGLPRQRRHRPGHTTARVARAATRSPATPWCCGAPTAWCSACSSRWRSGRPSAPPASPGGPCPPGISSPSSCPRRPSWHCGRSWIDRRHKKTFRHKARLRKGPGNTLAFTDGSTSVRRIVV